MKKRWYNCWLFHTFDNWSGLVEGETSYPFSKVAFKVFVQKRTCQVCNLIETRIV